MQQQQVKVEAKESTMRACKNVVSDDANHERIALSTRFRAMPRHSKTTIPYQYKPLPQQQFKEFSMTRQSSVIVMQFYFPFICRFIVFRMWILDNLLFEFWYFIILYLVIDANHQIRLTLAWLTLLVCFYFGSRCLLSSPLCTGFHQLPNVSPLLSSSLTAIRLMCTSCSKAAIL